MANRYLKAAGGNYNSAATWSATGSGGGDSAGVPGAGDNVILEAGSGNLTINVASACRSFDCMGGTGNYAGTVTHNANTTLSVGDGTAGPGNVAFRLSSGMTYTKNNTTSSRITFVSTSATQQTITFNGKTTGNLAIGGVGGSWLFADAWTGAATGTTALNLNAGTFDSGGKAIVCGIMQRQSNDGALVVTLGASAITLGNGGTPLDFSINTNVTLNEGTSSITFNNGPTTVDTDGFDWYDFTYSTGNMNPCHLIGGGSLHKLTVTGTASQVNKLLFGANMAIGELAPTGNSSPNRPLLGSTVDGTARTLTVTTFTGTDVDFRDIIGAGAAAPFVGTRLGDDGGNTNITFTASNRYLVSGNANTTHATSNHYAATSGGATAATSYPMPQDTLFVDANTGWTTGPRTLTTTSNQRHPALNATAMTQNWTVTGWSCLGSVTLATAKTTTNSSWTWRNRTGSTVTFTTGGAGGWVGSGSIITVGYMSGTLNMSDAVVVSGVNLSLSGGTFNGGAFNHTFATVSGTSGVTISAGLLQTWTVTSIFAAGSATLSFGLSGLTMSGASTGFSSVNGFDVLVLTFGAGAGNLAIQSGGLAAITVNALQIYGSGARTLTFSTGSSAVTFYAGGGGYAGSGAILTQLIGSAGNLITLLTTAAGTAVTMFRQDAGTVCGDYLSIKDSTVTGGAHFSAGLNSTNVSGNTGWNFTACPQTTYSTTDSLGATDTVSAAPGPTPTDPCGCVDAVTVELDTISVDALAGADSVSAGLDAIQTDAAGLTDSATATPGPAIEDAMGGVDDVSAELSVEATDAATLADTASVELAAELATEMGLTDDASADVGPTPVDSLGGEDDVTVELAASLAEDLGLTDSVASELSVILTTDELGMVDDILAALLPVITDLVDLTDVVEILVTPPAIHVVVEMTVEILPRSQTVEILGREMQLEFRHRDVETTVEGRSLETSIEQRTVETTIESATTMEDE